MHSSMIPDWARACAVRYPAIEPQRTAILVVDLQNGFVAPQGCMAIGTALEIIPQVNRATERFRNAGALIIFLRHTISDEPRFAIKTWPRERRTDLAIPPERFRPGRFDHEIFGELDRRAGDLVVDKHRYSAMLTNSSDLHDILSQRGIDTLVICGAATNVCCESTARDAAMLDYRVFFLSDATATINDELHNASLLNLSMLFADVRTTDETIALLSSELERRQGS